MFSTPTAARAHSWFLISAVAGAALVYGPRGGVDGITVSKASVVALSAVLALAVSGWAGVRAGTLQIPRSPALVAAGVLALVMALRTVLADERIWAVTGPVGRWIGLALYLACIILFVVAVARGTDPFAARVVRGLLVAGIAVALVAVDEAYFGLGPQWGARPGAAGTLGNANFLAAWSACVFALAVSVAADRSQPLPWRAVGAVAVPSVLVATVVSRSFQGGYVVAAVLAVLGLAWAAERLSRRMFVTVASAVGVAGLAGAAVTVLGAMNRGPAAFFSGQIGVRLRAEYWAAAGRMIADHPLGGVGPGTFMDHYRQYRSVEAANLVALQSNTDSAHNVSLHLFAEWGALVGLAHVAVLVVVTALMVRELRRRHGVARLQYAGVGAAWLGYVLQSTISIDTPSLAVLGWVLAGLVVAPTVSDSWNVSLPWRRIGATQDLPMGARLADYGIAAAGVMMVWVVLIPWRADVASTGGEIRVDRQADDQPRAQTRATELAPWETRYWMHLATVLAEQGEGTYVDETIEHALTVAPNRFEVVVNAARQADFQEDFERARRHYERALELEPSHPDLAVEVAEYALERDDPEWARELLDRALETDPGHGPAQDLKARL